MTGGYPSWSISPDTAARTGRLPREARDELVRAVRLLDLDDWTGTAR